MRLFLISYVNGLNVGPANPTTVLLNQWPTCKGLTKLDAVFGCASIDGGNPLPAPHLEAAPVKF